MEHYTESPRHVDESDYDLIPSKYIVEEHQNLDETTRSKLACMYRETAKEAMVYARKIAEEDANIAAAILAEDLKQARRR